MAIEDTNMPARQSSGRTKQSPKKYRIPGWEIVKEDAIALYKTKTLKATKATIEEMHGFKRG
jgi:hypothetical protein